MEELFEQLKKEGKCCICDNPLAYSQYMNLINVRVPAAWAFPVWGNVLTGEDHLACAYSCDSCYEKGMNQQQTLVVRSVLEWTESNKFIYHPIVPVGDQYCLAHSN